MASSQEERQQALHYHSVEVQLLQITGMISEAMEQHFAYLDRHGISDDPDNRNAENDERWIEAVVVYWRQLTPEKKKALDAWASKTTYAQRVRAVADVLSDTYQRERYKMTDEERREYETNMIALRKIADDAEDD